MIPRLLLALLLCLPATALCAGSDRFSTILTDTMLDHDARLGGAIAAADKELSRLESEYRQLQDKRVQRPDCFTLNCADVTAWIHALNLALDAADESVDRP